MYSFEKFRMTYHEEIRQFPLHFIGGFNASEIVGWGAIKMTGVQCQQAGIKHALLVTTGLRGTGIIEEVQAICKHAGVETSIFKVGQSNPREEDAYGAVQAFKNASADGFLSVGGGSSHDTAKAARLLMANPDLPLTNFAFKLDPHYTNLLPTIKPCIIPQVAVNTTAGTGAEMTGFGTFTNWKLHWKYCSAAPNMIPAMGILDPACLRTMPERIAAQTGFDCFCHSISGYTTRVGNQVSKALGMRGARMVWENLPEFVYNRLNDKACEAMAWAQYLGALTYALGGGGDMVHGLAHQVSGVSDIHHGLANSIIVAKVFKYNLSSSADTFSELARDAFGADIRNMNRFQAAEALIDKIEYLRNIVGIIEEDCKLSKYNISKEDCKHMAKYAVNDLCAEGNPRDMTEEDAIKFYMEML